MILNTLIFLCYAGALFSACAYVYGYIVKSKGDRRWHTAGLLFAGLALANLPPLLRAGAANDQLFGGGMVTVLLLLALGCQSVTALRGRRSDRRGRAADAAQPTVAAPQSDRTESPEIAPAPRHLRRIA